MAGFIDNHEIEIPCKNGGRKTIKTIGWIKTHAELACACGTTISLVTDQFKRQLRDVEKSIEDFKRAIKKLAK